MFMIRSSIKATSDRYSVDRITNEIITTSQTPLALWKNILLVYQNNINSARNLTWQRHFSTFFKADKELTPQTPSKQNFTEKLGVSRKSLSEAEISVFFLVSKQPSGTLSRRIKRFIKYKNKWRKHHLFATGTNIKKMLRSPINFIQKKY